MARPSTINATNASNTELWNSGSYAFDGSGNIKAIGNTAYYYDAFDRLSGWKTAGTSGAYDWIGRRYDGFGNYLSAFEKVCMTQVSGQTQRCFTSNFASQQVLGTTNHYSGVTYDDAGNITAQSGRTFTWDSLGVMTGATANGRTFRYLYTPDDERVAVVERVVDGNVTRNRTTWSARDFENRLLTTWTDDATSGTRTITWKEDEIWRGQALLANLSSSGTKHYILDHLGSTRFITNASGQAVGPQNFAPFGSGGSTGSGTLQFAGMERDLTAVGSTFPDLPDYDHHRFYDLDWGRFLSVDPVIAPSVMQLTQGWNRYVYVRNNPLKFTDPTGLDPTCITVKGERKDGKDGADQVVCSDEITVTGKKPEVTNALGAAHSIIDLIRWGTGNLPRRSAADPTSAAELSNTPVMDKIRDEYKRSGCRDDEYYGKFDVAAFLHTGSVTGQVVGSFGADIRSIGHGQVVVTAFNSWGLESATRIYGTTNEGNPSVQRMLGGGALTTYPKSLLENLATGPGATATLNYVWIEGSPCAP